MLRTKKAATAVARAMLATGYYRDGRQCVYHTCPHCRQRIETLYGLGCSYQSPVPALRARIVEHLLEDCGQPIVGR